jgi:hypothetical protein
VTSGKGAVRDPLFGVVGTFLVISAAATLVLFIANLRSHLKYGSPNYHLEWAVTYFVVTGIGVLRRKRWGVLLTFGPALMIVFVMVAHPNDSWILALAWCAALAALPIALTRRWKSLSWV